MQILDTVQSVASRLTPYARLPEMLPPRYSHRPNRPNLALAVASMKDHMTDEGWQVMDGLSHSGYRLCGYGLDEPSADVLDLINRYDPGCVLVQDKREWDLTVRDFRDPLAVFTNCEALANRPGIFKLTVLKDAHQRPNYHRDSAREIGCHAWVTYYHPTIVKRLAPYVRERHLIRTWHTLDPAIVPPYSSRDRSGCLLSGAVSTAYPLRQRLVRCLAALPETTVLPHPGYHRRGCATPDFFKTLSRYKVAICTASVYGYALRKMIEATAAGCVVITNLPHDEDVPEINHNLVRVPADATAADVAKVVRHCIDKYDPDLQEMYARMAKARFDYRLETARLANEIDKLRANYHAQGVPAV